MIRLLGFVAALICSISPLAPAFAAPDNRNLPMRFELRREGPAESCEPKCRTWISATGAITADTAREFLAFAAGRSLQDTPVVLNSDGGSVHGAIALGRALRQLDLTTTVGRTQELSPKEGEVRATLTSVADCESMCAFVLLGGARRHVPADARVMVHQIWLGDRRDDPTAANYSAEDLVLVQRDIGRLAQYVVEMGGTGELLDLALRIPPWEPMRRLSRDELARARLATIDDPFRKLDDAVLTTVAAAPPAPSTTGTRRMRTGQQGWLAADRSGALALTRRHPLTVEGDDLGMFDIAVTCGDDADTYKVSYSERRRDASGKQATLQSVNMRIAGRQFALPVVSSEMRGQTPMLETYAAGTVPASLFKMLGGSESRSMIVTTAAGGETTTSIRLGNSGIAQNFAAFSDRCVKYVAERNDAPREKTNAAAYAHAQPRD